MGYSFKARCIDCDYLFTVDEDGGFRFHLLHCDKCGKDKSMPFDEIGEPHLRYIKGLRVTYSIATSESDKHIQDHYPGEPLSEKDYHKIVEEQAGNCKCGGSYKFDAPPRCPKCRSTRFENNGEEMVMYD